MAKETIGTIELDIPAEWDRKTIADGTWLQRNTLKPIYDNEKTLAAAISDASAAFETSASRIFFEDDDEDILNDLYFRNTEGRAYAAELSNNGTDANMIIPFWSKPDHETRQLFFGWNAEDGYDFYEQSAQMMPDMSGSNYIEVKRVVNPDGHDTYSASFIPNKIRSWTEQQEDVGNILIREHDGYLEFSAGAPSQRDGGESTIYHLQNSGQSSTDVVMNLRYYEHNGDLDSCTRVEAFEASDQSDGEFEYLWPKKREAQNRNDDALFCSRANGSFMWMDASAVSRVSIGVPVNDSNILCVL